MTYKSFEDFYREAEIKHLILHEYNGGLISPPFCTDTCKDYSRVLIIKDNKTSFIDVDTPPATSKYSAMASIDDSIFFIPYGIWDSFNLVLEIKDNKPIYHNLDSTSRGQFYNMASNGEHAFSAPLGYEEISFCLFIKNGKIKQVPVPSSVSLKRHMGSVFLNGSYYSPPRGEDGTYNSILKFNPVTEKLSTIEVNGLPLSQRKYSDFIAIGNKLYGLPFGKYIDLKEMLVLDTADDSVSLIPLDLPKFQKKYNAGVALDNIIVAMPYGHKDDGDANFGLIFDTDTNKHFTFDVEQQFGGKYRFRSGIEFDGNAVFLPTGSPTIPITAVTRDGKIIYSKLFADYVIGRPLLYSNMIYSMAYHLENKEHYLFTIDKQFNVEFTFLF